MLFNQRMNIGLVDWSWLAYRSVYSKHATQISSYLGNVYAGPSVVLYQSLAMLLKRFDTLIFCLDGYPKHKFEKFPFYKAQRREVREKDESYETNKALRGQLKLWLIQTIPSVIAYNPSEEADDCIGTLATRLAAIDYVHIHIISTDKDLWQLLSPKIHLWENDEEVTPARVQDYFGTTADKIPLYKAWFGDSSDNIPKLHRMPTKLGIALVNASENVEDSIAKIPQIVPSGGPTNWQKRFLDFADTARKNFELALINRNLPVPFAYFKPDFQPLAMIFDTYKITSFSASDIYEPLLKGQLTTLQVLLQANLLDPSKPVSFEEFVAKL